MLRFQKKRGAVLGLYLLGVAVMPVSLHAQDKSTLNKQLALIRQRYDAIDSAAKKYTIRKQKVENKDPIGDGRDRSYTGYYENHALRKIVVTSFGDHGSDTYKYYFWQGKLFFLHHTGTGYYGQATSKPVKWQERLYFSGDKVIRWLGDDNAPKPIDTLATREAANDMRAESQNAAKILSTSKERP